MTAETFEDLCEATGYGTDWEQLAVDADVSVRTIFNIRYGLRQPTRGTIALLAGAFGVPTRRVQKAVEHSMYE